MLYISDVMNMVGMIEFRIFSTACVMSIIGYHYALGNFIFGTLKVQKQFLNVTFEC